MVQQRAACSGESTSLNGVQNGHREGGTAEPEAASDQHSTSNSTISSSNTGRFSLFKWFKRAGNRDGSTTSRRIEKRRKTKDKSNEEPEQEEEAEEEEQEERKNRRRSDVSSSVESVDTFYSTTTVRSFAFHAGTLGRCNGLSLDVLKQSTEVGPFAPGASKVGKDDVASTLPSSVHSSRRTDITARYSLQPSTTLFNSCGNLPSDRQIRSASLRRFDEAASRTKLNGSRRRVHVKGKRRAPNPPVIVSKPGEEVDVRETPRNSNRRKRRAPRPPEKTIVEGKEIIEGAEEELRKDVDAIRMDVAVRKDGEEEQTISNDTLVLQAGVLLSKKDIRQSPKAAPKEPSNLLVHQENYQTVGTLSTAMPRPWYKRSVFEHSRDAGSPSTRRGDVLRGPTTSIEVKEECVATNVASYSVDASLSRLSFFHRGERQSEERKREVKRKSGLSILTNISELDKEAAAIVQEEQARARASMLLKSSRFVDAFEKRNDVNVNEEIVQDMVTSAMENSSPRRGTRALISKFNAISNITKVTVNANFFAKTGRDQQTSKFERDVVRNSRFEQTGGDWREHARFSVQQGSQGVRVERDISRYFLPQQRAQKNKAEATRVETGKEVLNTKINQGKGGNDRLATETSSRISFLQSQLAGNRMNETPQRDAAMAVMEEKIRSSQESVGEERKERDAGFDGKRYSSQGSGTENALGVARESKQGEKVENTRSEFANIFEELDKQLRNKEFKFVDRQRASTSGEYERKEREDEEMGISSKVTKVLDILVEAEKDNKARTERAQLEKPLAIEEHVTRPSDDFKSKSNKTKSTLNTVEDPVTTDLKEMLKEMKHSLPKRSKPKKSAEVQQIVSEKINTEADVPAVSTKAPYHVSPSAKATEVNAIAQSDYETDKQKVSSAAQTSGNVRRLNQPLNQPERPSTSGWRQENVLYRTSGKNLGGTGLVKNTFQLIRPRDFAEIEAMKTSRGGSFKENTYANVIEQSLYANAHVPPPTKQMDVPQSKNKILENNGTKMVDITPLRERKINVVEENFGTTGEEEDDTAERNMNTLAINRLLRKLEAAIASGHHQQAAGLAKELARLKIHCSVVRQRTARFKDQLIKVNMYIEDKLAHQGPIPLQLPTRMTVAELKRKVQMEFEIPTNVQRWIIGKNLADQDETTLEKLQAVEGSPVFLYLVAPELQNETASQGDKASSTEEPSKRTDKETTSSETLEIIEEIQEITQAMDEPEKEETSEEAKMEQYEELMLLENCDVIPNSEPIECPVCFATYGPREGVILRDCLHMFCRPCLANIILYCEEAEVKCPYRDTEYTCESTLQEREIKALVEPKIYQQHLAKSIAQAENNAGNNAFHCKTPDCPGWCIYDDDVNNFLCPVCDSNNCLTCQAIHTGKNCKQYQQQLRFPKETDQESRRTAAMLEEMVDRGEALACPTCAVVLMKKWGCDWLRCSMCKTEICWVTRGPRWGPGGKGDTSGGCRCGENGVKCHPRCNYCH